jgi:hypothetical protein
MRSLTRLPRSLRTNKVAVWGGCSYTGRAPGANRLGNCAPRKIGASWTWKVFKKGLKTLPIMPVDRCGGLAGPIGRFYRNPAKTHVFTDSCSEPLNRTGEMILFGGVFGLGASAVVLSILLLRRGKLYHRLSPNARLDVGFSFSCLRFLQSSLFGFRCGSPSCTRRSHVF